ncbi:MAG: ASCH domain-containing protein [Nitrososphaerota archaeon]
MTLRKCLSLKQPFAELVVTGKKTIELRKWNTKFRGEFLVHASKTVNKEACERNKINPDSLITGAIVGRAILYDVRFYDSGRSFLQDRKKHFAGTGYAGPVYGFLLRGARKFRKPFVMKGKLGFFNVEYET